jgi:hypothetical protein
MEGAENINGKEYHVAPCKCWAKYLETKTHKERDRVGHRNQIEGMKFFPYTEQSPSPTEGDC